MGALTHVGNGLTATSNTCLQEHTCAHPVTKIWGRFPSFTLCHGCVVCDGVIVMV